jgi:hypothetical protein
MAVGADTKSLDPKAARILLEAVAATWELYRLWEIPPPHYIEGAWLL